MVTNPPGFDDLPRTAAPLFSRAVQPTWQQIDGEQLLGIGNDYGTTIGVVASGQVWSMDPHRRIPDRYINSNLETFRDCLATYNRLLPTIAADESAIDALAQGLEEIDGTALSDEGNWWTLILWQHRNDVG